MPPQEPISSHSQHRSVKSRIARYLRRTTLSSFAVLASQITTASNSQVPDICSSTTFEVASSSSSSDDDNKQQEQQCLCRQESDTTHSLRARSNTVCGSYAMLPIDEGFHQSQQKLFSSTVSQEAEEEKSGDAYKYGKSHSPPPPPHVLLYPSILPSSSLLYKPTPPPLPFSLIQIPLLEYEWLMMMMMIRYLGSITCRAISMHSPPL